MSDTVKMARPHFPRKKNGASGRVEHDSKGNAVWVRTRATDSHDIDVTADLSLAEEPRQHSRAPLTRAHKISPGKGRR